MRNYVYKESEGLYERSKLITGAVSLFVNVTGPIANKYGAKCFAAGTAVHTKTGTKTIEEIEIGDEVLSYDEETGTQGYKPVVRLYRNVTEEWYHIHVNGEELRCTAEHPFYVVDKGFVPARGIHSSDKVLQSDGKCGIIEAVEIERLSEPERTYNFEVADYHTYYVGSGILTHNKCWGTERRHYWKSQGERYSNSINEINKSESGTYNLSKENIRDMLEGKAPIGTDGYKVHLHHVVGKKVDLYNYIEVTRTYHYENFKLLHPWLYK